MRIPDSGLYIDNPAFPLLRAHISYWNLTSAAGLALGTTLVCAGLANEPSYAGLVVKPLDGPSAGQVRTIDTHVGNTLTVVAAFTNAAGGVQQIAASTTFVILSAEGVAALSSAIDLIFDIVNAQFKLQETGGTLTADGTEQVLVQVDAPMGVFKPTKINLNCTNMAWGDSIVLRWYERISGGTAYVQKDELRIDDFQVIPLKPIELQPNRHGVRVTLTQRAGVNRDYPWEYFYES